MQQCDANAIHDCLLTFCRLDSVLAKTCLVNPVDRYLMLGYEVADDRMAIACEVWTPALL